MDFLSWQQISAVEEQSHLLQSLFIDTGSVRSYEYGECMAHLIGYMGRVDPSQKSEFVFVDENFRLGKNGLEKFYEDQLRGEFGYKQIEINAHGQYVRELLKQQAVVGQDLHLNIDAELQRGTISYLPLQSCSAVVMDATDGGVRLMSSMPSFDPNSFNLLSNRYWLDLINDPYKPLINKAVHSSYPPGSIFKIITILAALDSGIDPEHRIHCSGAPLLGGNSFRCAKKSGHGLINMYEGLSYSCNIYMFNIARMIGPQKIIDTAHKFGFGKPTGVDLPIELAGFVPSLKWKQEKFKTKWSVGDTFNLAIGQGFLLCTPMQLAAFINTIATNGKLYTPRIVKSCGDVATEARFVQLDIAPQHLAMVQSSLYNTVNAPGGTAYGSRLACQAQMAGKTGTAQVIAKRSGNDDLSRSDIAWHKRNHAIFTGYAPHDKPKYSIAVYYDHGGGGGRAAAPIAKAIMEQALGL